MTGDDFKKMEEILTSTEAQEVPKDDCVTLSNGVVLQVFGISPFLFREIEKKYPNPPVPTVFNPDKGRHEENPLDPEYVKACEAQEALRNEAMIDLVIGYGAKIVSVPEHLPNPDDLSWIDRLAFVLSEDELEVLRRNPYIRQIAWIKYIAICTQSDIESIALAVFRRMGVSTEDVSAALSSFQGNTTRDTDTGI